MKNVIKIVSLIPSATEILCALGLKEKIVGRSHECDFPHEIQNIPICTQTFVDSSLNSKKIDEQVQYSLIQGLSIYSIDLKLITKLNPSLIVTQSQCNVCAVDLNQLKELTQTFEKIKIVALQAKCLAGIYEDIQKIADTAEIPLEGKLLVDRIKFELSQLHLKVSDSNKRKILCVEWIEPLMAAGNWIPSLVELAGGENLLSTEGNRSPYIEIQDFISADPDLIIFMACGFDIERTLKELNPFFQKKEIKQLKAIKNNQVFVVDANHFFVRPGPRIVESLKILCEIIHPEKLEATFKDVGWQKLSIA